MTRDEARAIFDEVARINDCDDPPDDPGSHEPECGRCGTCESFGDCCDLNPPVRWEDIH